MAVYGSTSYGIPAGKMRLDTLRFRFIAEALNGNGGFRPRVVLNASDVPELSGSSHLVKYPREGDEKFARRNQVAWYANDLKSAASRFIGYLSKRTPQRGGGSDNPLLSGFVEDADWQGHNLDTFWGMFGVEAKARGCMLLLVDMPTDIGDTRADQIEARRFPYLTPIPPEAVVEYELDERGRLFMVEIGIGGGRTRGWDESRWWIKEGVEEIGGGEHNLGRCPVLAFAEGTFPAEGEFAQIADLSKRLFNLRSELDEILRAQTFGLLTYQIPADQAGNINVDDIAAQIGTNNMLIHSGNTPAFISPDDGPARVYIDVIEQLEEKIRRIGHVVEAPDRAESGVALTIRFQQLNSSLSAWARNMQDLETEVWDIVGRWLGLKADVSVTWDDDFALTDVPSELGVLEVMQGTGFSAATLAAKRRQIVSLDMGNLPDEDLATLIDSEGEPLHEGADEAAGGVGDPGDEV